MEQSWEEREDGKEREGKGMPPPPESQCESNKTLVTPLVERMLIDCYYN